MTFIKLLLLIFVFGSFTAAFAQLKTITGQFDDAPQTDFCEMLRNPRFFIGKNIRTVAIWRLGFEMGWLEFPSTCDIADGDRSAIRDIWDTGYASQSDKDVTKKLKRLLREKNEKNHFVSRVSGSFIIRVREFKKTNPNDKRFDYDFVIMKILSAEKPKP